MSENSLPSSSKSSAPAGMCQCTIPWKFVRCSGNHLVTSFQSPAGPKSCSVATQTNRQELVFGNSVFDEMKRDFDEWKACRGEEPCCTPPPRRFRKTVLKPPKQFASIAVQTQSVKTKSKGVNTMTPMDKVETDFSKSCTVSSSCQTDELLPQSPVYDQLDWDCYFPETPECVVFHADKVYYRKISEETLSDLLN